MTPAEKNLRSLVSTWAARLGLAHFDIDVQVCQFDPATDAADCSCQGNYDKARLRFQPWLLKGKPPEGAEFVAPIEEVVVHELLHISVRPFRRAKALVEEGSYLQRDAQSLFEEAWDQREEEAVDRLAVALVKAWGA